MTIFEALDEANRRLREAIKRCVICGQDPNDAPCTFCELDLDFLDRQEG